MDFDAAAKTQLMPDGNDTARSNQVLPGGADIAPTVEVLPGDIDTTWSTAVFVLNDLLQKAPDGAVSTQALRRELESRGIPEVRELVARLKAVDFDSPDAPPSTTHWYHFGRSFLTEKAYREAQRSQEVEADKAEERAGEEEVGDDTEGELEEQPTPERRRRKAEERRMGTYIVPVLEELYDSDFSPDNYVFDVHSEKSGEVFENIDLLAVHWRSELMVDLVTVEVKLQFSPFLVQQARNYCRFSDRVWIAIPVSARTAKEAAAELRAAAPLLFDHVVDVGLGILACHRGQGGAYDVFPIHWPRKMSVDGLERERLIARYRKQFEEACVVAPAPRTYPAW